MYIASCRRDTWRHHSPETTKVDTNRRFTIARSVAVCELPRVLIQSLSPAWIGMLRLRKIHCRLAAKSRNDVLYFSTLKRETRKLLTQCIRLCTIASHLIIFLSEFYEMSDILQNASPVKNIQHMVAYCITKVKALLWYVYYTVSI